MDDIFTGVGIGAIIGAIAGFVWGLITGIFGGTIVGGIVYGILTGVILGIGGGIIGLIVGVIVKKVKEKVWYSKNRGLQQKANTGDVDAMYQLGERWLESWLDMESFFQKDEAIKWFEMAADNGNEEAKKKLIYIAKREAAKKADEEAKKAAEEAREAAEKADEEAWMAKTNSTGQQFISERRKCLTCEYWGGNSGSSFYHDIEALREKTGHCLRGENYHPISDARLSARDSCNFWKINPALTLGK
jgi:hypothetical protein